MEIGFRTENNNIIYFVKDNGIGIDPKLADTILMYFYDSQAMNIPVPAWRLQRLKSLWKNMMVKFGYKQCTAKVRVFILLLILSPDL